SNTPLVTPQLYSGAYTGDIKYVVGHIINKIPNVSLFAFGFSLGSNVLIKYAGEMGESCPLAGCCSIGNPYDFLGGLRALHRTWFNRTVYSTQMAKNLSNMFRKHSHAFKDILEMDHEAIYNAKYLVDFDEACTRRAFNFRSADEYYRHASCAQHVPDVAIPTLLFSALDDPIAPPELIPYRESRANPHVILATTAHGGHLGWFDGTSIQNILFPGRRWFAKPVAEFAKAILLA
ncbi:Alpha/Beta hydrolase protein, partial [Entophlyctis helioformis]